MSLIKKELETRKHPLQRKFESAKSGLKNKWEVHKKFQGELKTEKQKAFKKEKFKVAREQGKAKARGGFFKKPVVSRTKRKGKAPKVSSNLFSLGSGEGSAFDIGTFGTSKKKKEKDAFDLF